MNKKLYLECFSGISGDMLVASLLDLGADWEHLTESLKKLKLDGYEVKQSRVKKSGLDACDFQVALDAQHENHDHDMRYLHGAYPHTWQNHGCEQNHDHDYVGHHEHGADGDHEVNYEHGQDGVHDDHEHHHDGMHVHRGPKEIAAIIREASLGERAEQIALKIFDVLAHAEAKAHGVEIENVLFHEVGAVDSIVDIVSIAVCIDNLGITEVIVPRLCEGGGMIRCQHGLIPVPVPAVVNIVKEHQLVLQRMGVDGELVTPTGAAAVAALITSRELPQEFTVTKVGLGAGKRDYKVPGILRAMLIEAAGTQENVIYKLETNVDDCTGENLGYVMEALFAAGARDVHYIPVFMKKNRPAYQLNVICAQEDVAEIEQIIFAQTTTIGIRRQRMERSVMEREIREVDTSFGRVKAKVCSYLQEEKVYPEYESVAGICRRTGMPYTSVYETVAQECREKIKKGVNDGRSE